jgi:hypothetical protein
MRNDGKGVSASSRSFVNEQECALISDEELTVLSRCGETVTKFVKLSVDAIPAELLVHRCSSMSTEFSENDNEDEIVRKSIHSRRRGRFPFANNLDDLVVHPTILSLAAQALFPTKTEEWSSRDCWFGFPRLLEAHLVLDAYPTATDDASYRKNNINRHDIDAIILKINLPLLDDRYAYVDLTRRMDWATKFDISRKQSALGSIANEHTATATGIRVIFCTSCQGRSGSYIRYVAGGKWFASLSPLQRASLGFPPPGHWYWQQKGTLRQAVARYGQFGFDPLPYNTDYYTVQKIIMKRIMQETI